MRVLRIQTAESKVKDLGLMGVMSIHPQWQLRIGDGVLIEVNSPLDERDLFVGTVSGEIYGGFGRDMVYSEHQVFACSDEKPPISKKILDLAQEMSYDKCPPVSFVIAGRKRPVRLADETLHTWQSIPTQGAEVVWRECPVQDKSPIHRGKVLARLHIGRAGDAGVAFKGVLVIVGDVKTEREKPPEPPKPPEPEKEPEPEKPVPLSSRKALAFVMSTGNLSQRMGKELLKTLPFETGPRKAKLFYVDDLLKALTKP